MSVFLLSESLFCPLMLICLWCWSNFVSRMDAFPQDVRQRWSGMRWIAVGGIASGVATLARPSWMLWPFLLVGLLALIVGLKEKAWQSRWESWKWGWFFPLWIFAIAMAVTMSPWWIRNYYVIGRFVPTTLQVGPSLYDSLHAGASGASDEGMSFSLPFENTLREEFRTSPESFNGRPFEYELIEG